MAAMGKSAALRPFPLARRPLCPNLMAGAETSGGFGPKAYDEAYPAVADALTLRLLRKPAQFVTQRAVHAGTPAWVLIAGEALLALLVFALFWKGRYWPGLLVAIAVMIADVAAFMLARLSHAPRGANRSRLALEIVEPLLWWWAWEHGLTAYGKPLEPIYATMVLWVVVGGTIAIRAVEALAQLRFNGMELHAWQPLDTRFRLVSASRNTNLVILAAALLFGRPESGLVLVAWWTLISLIFHSVRLAQLTERQARRVKIGSWLDQ